MIHQTAIIDPKSKIGENVIIGPWCVIGADVEIGDDCVLDSHISIIGPTKIGKSNHFYPFSVIGADCQDKKYAGEVTTLEIGDHNIIREHCSIHRGTVQGGGKTVIGSHNLIMVYVHIAHDCIVGDHIILSGYSAIAGHVVVDDWAILGGYVGAHQFCKIGTHSFCATSAVVNKDVAPYVRVTGHPAKVNGLNGEGLKRRGYTSNDVKILRRAYKILFRQGLSLADATPLLEALVPECAHVKDFIDFIPEATRGLTR